MTELEKYLSGIGVGYRLDNGDLYLCRDGEKRRFDFGYYKVYKLDDALSHIWLSIQLELSKCEMFSNAEWEVICGLIGLPYVAMND